MKLLALSLCLGLLTSCATLFNTHYTKVNIQTKQDSVKVYFDDSSNYVYTPAKLVVERSSQPLKLTLETDSLKREISLPSQLAPEFWLGNVLNGTLGLGCLLDLSNQKRFTYPLKVYCDLEVPNQLKFGYRSEEHAANVLSQEDRGLRKKTFVGEKGSFNLKISIPEGNSFVLNKGSHIGNAFGFLGITTGLDYYYRDKEYIGVGAGTLTDFIIPIPAPYDVFGEYERSFGAYYDLLHGLDMHRFSINYGLSISKFSYYKRILAEIFPNYIDSVLYSGKEFRYGFSFSTKFKFSPYLHAGIKYLPSFKTIHARENQYGHLLFLDLACNFEIKRKNGKGKEKPRVSRALPGRYVTRPAPLASG